MIATPSSSPDPFDPDAPVASWKLVDGVRLIALLRAGDEDAINEAYRRTFAGALGHLVLAHHLQACGHGQLEGRDMSAADRTYNAGRRDAALGLMSKAGFDEASAAAAVLTDNLEGQTYERTDAYPASRSYADPAGEPWNE